MLKRIVNRKQLIDFFYLFVILFHELCFLDLSVLSFDIGEVEIPR